MTQILSRREFLAASGAGAVAIVAPQTITQALAASRADRSKLLTGGKFATGVLSGDPSPGGITLFSALDGVEAAGQVIVEVASDSAFRKVVATKKVNTSAAIGHGVKARVTGLKANQRYYYRFQGKSAESPVGRFQTALPADSNQPVKFAFFSCQEYTFGFYNAHQLLAREDVDFVVNLGDYVYSDLAFPSPLGVRPLPPDPSGNAKDMTLVEYRQRYSNYRADANLRAMHAKFPMISCWDDHEVANDYAGADPKGGGAGSDLTGKYPYSVARRNAAYQAFFQAMPTFQQGRQRLYHKAAFGKHMDLFVLDERQYRAAQPCNDEPGPACADLGKPRAFLGSQQNAFLRSGMQKSKASWKVIANEVVIMGLKRSASEYDDFDAWDGYPAEREALLGYIRKNKIEDVVFVTGDYHAFLAGSVEDAAKRKVAAEFVCGSVTSATDPEVNAIQNKPGFGTIENPSVPASYTDRTKFNPYYKELDFLSHGYIVCEAGPKTFKATYKKLKTIRQKSTALKPGKTYTVHRGTPGL